MLVLQRPLQRGLVPEKGAVTFFGWAFFLISLGSPHVRPMGVHHAGVHRTCGEPTEIESTPHGGEIERLTTRTASQTLRVAWAQAAPRDHDDESNKKVVTIRGNLAIAQELAVFGARSVSPPDLARRRGAARGAAT